MMLGCYSRNTIGGVGIREEFIKGEVEEAKVPSFSSSKWFQAALKQVRRLQTRFFPLSGRETAWRGSLN
jgi:hypothetical protein